MTMEYLDRVEIPVESEASAHVARRRAREVAEDLGWSSTRVAELETAVSEVATNTWVHAGGGRIEITVEERRGGPTVVVIARDRGPGIPDVDRAMRDGASTAGTLGLGLSALSRLMDDLRIETEPGVGTTIHMAKAERRPSQGEPPGLGLAVVEFVEGAQAAFGNVAWARASRPEGGTGACGDAALVKPTRFGELLAVVDGAGHGAPAAIAADEALAVVARYAEQSPAEILVRCHDALASTAGAAVSVIKINALSNTLVWAGIGNVEAATWSPGSVRPSNSLVPRSGTLGYQVPPVKETTVEIAPGDMIVAWTDGIRTAAVSEVDIGAGPREVAARILADGARQADDALVLAVHYLGGTLQ